MAGQWMYRGHQVYAIPKHRQRAVSQEIYLDQASPLGAVFFPGQYR